MKSTKILLTALFLVLFAQLFVPLASAAVYNINGTVNRSDTNVGLGGATVTNDTNTTTTSTTAPIGWFNLPNMQNNTGRIGWTITYSAPGFVQQINYTNVSGADNFTNNVSLVPVTPAVSAVTVSSISNTGATIAWTVTAVDNVNNNYVGNRVLYSQDSALVNGLFYSAWSNDTASPSITLSNLYIGVTWYFRVQTYNKATSAYSATSDSNFATTKGKDPNAYYKQFATPQPTTQAVQPVVTPVQPQGALSSGAVTGGTSGQPNKTFVGFIAVVIIGAIVVMWFMQGSTKTSYKHKKSKRK